MMYSKQQSAEMLQQEALNRSAITVELEVAMKSYEASLLRNDPDADKYRNKVHDIIDALMDSQISAIRIVQNTRYF